jgi:S1-C subfamily serine protease
MEMLQQLNADMGRVVAQARRSLVRISNGREGQGAGTIWSADGMVITNAHVVRRSSPKVTLPDGRALPAKVLAHDDERDLALLSVEASGLSAIQSGDSQNLRPGEWVFALGHPWGVAGSATAGIVIGTGSEMPEMPASGREWIMVSLRLRPGNSGGPLVDARGRLIGVNTMMTGPEVGGAIPVHVVNDFARRAMS